MAKTRPVDETDLAIIRRLQVDGRRAYADIAAELGLAPSTVQQRTHRLLRSGLIEVHAVTDPVAMGVPVTATIAVKADGTRLREAAADIARFSEVGYVVICTGPYDILLEVGCKDNDHLLEFISSKLSKVHGVRETETFLYLRFVKNTYQWGLPELEDLQE